MAEQQRGGGRMVQRKAQRGRAAYKRERMEQLQRVRRVGGLPCYA